MVRLVLEEGAVVRLALEVEEAVALEVEGTLGRAVLQVDGVVLVIVLVAMLALVREMLVARFKGMFGGFAVIKSIFKASLQYLVFHFTYLQQSLHEDTQQSVV